MTVGEVLAISKVTVERDGVIDIDWLNYVMRESM
jgi:hypothetical protein